MPAAKSNASSRERSSLPQETDPAIDPKTNQNKAHVEELKAADEKRKSEEPKERLNLENTSAFGVQENDSEAVMEFLAHGGEGLRELTASEREHLEKRREREQCSTKTSETSSKR